MAKQPAAAAAPSPEEPPAAAPAHRLITVRARQAMHEDYRIEKGETFETTAERAAALGDLVEPAS